MNTKETTPSFHLSNQQLPVDVVKEEDVFDGQWIVTKRVKIAKSRGESEKQENWEIVVRKKPADTETHGVYIVPIIQYNSVPKYLVVVKQFRLPVRNFVLEFPGGFIKEGQTAEETAIRELWEETGYRGTVINISHGKCTEAAPVLYATCKVATVIIDGDSPENANPEQHIPVDEIELVEVFLLPLSNLLSELRKFSQMGINIMSDLYNFALGTEFSTKFHKV